MSANALAAKRRGFRLAKRDLDPPPRESAGKEAGSTRC